MDRKAVPQLIQPHNSASLIVLVTSINTFLFGWGMLIIVGSKGEHNGY